MKRVFTWAFFLASFAAGAQPVSALPPGQSLVFDGKGADKVVFDGPLHKAKGFTCKDCHTPPTKFFEMKKNGNVMTMRDMESGKFCGGCHNGVIAFGMKEASACSRCHKKD